MSQPKLREQKGVENQFKEWVCKDATQSTARTYWQRIEDFPWFDLVEDNQFEITGKLNKRLETQEQKTAVSQFLQFLHEQRISERVGNEKYERLRQKKNSIQANLELPKSAEENKKDDFVKEAQKQFIPADELIELFRVADPDRARFYYLLYAGGFRIGELKRLTPAHLRGNYGENGAVRIVEDRSKSKKDRIVEFHSDLPLNILEDAPTGEWIDENDKKWEGVYYPEFYSQLERYYLKKWCEEIGLSPRTAHSFRHTRITHLVHSDEYSKDYVQRRSGHENSAMTDYYTELVFDKPPQTIENYIQENEIDLIQVLDS